MITTKTRRDFLGLAACGLVAACVPFAASAGQSNLSRSMLKEARKAGVPAECIEKMTNADVAHINSISNRPRLAHANRNRRIREYVKKICRTR